MSLDKLHKKLCKKYSWYAHWHTFPGVTVFHFLAVATVVAAGGSMINQFASAGYSDADLVPPTVMLSMPSNGQEVKGMVTIAATASDDTSVQKVEVWEDGSLIAQDSNPPYRWGWDTETDTEGAHLLQLKAYDNSGNSDLSPAVIVTVKN